MSKKGAEPTEPTPPALRPMGRPNGTARVMGEPAPRRERNPLKDFAERLGKTAARDAFRGSCMVSTTEILFALALAYAAVMTALRFHTLMMALPH